MKILLTGANGQLGQDLRRIALTQSINVHGVDINTMDITQPKAIAAVMGSLNPDMVINTAAYTAVDRAEQDEALAFAVNRDGAQYLAQACADANVPLLHISTDYVFNGQATVPYKETDAVAPMGVYGQSKWAGEQAIREVLPQHIILRISWLYGEFGQNFVKTMQRLAREREVLKVVADQVGCPTATHDVAHAALRIARQVTANASVANQAWGTYHYCGQPATTWYDFAQAIIQQTARYETLTVKQIKPLTTAEYPTPAARPAYSVLDCHAIQQTFGIEPVPWQVSLRQVIEALRGQ